MVPFFTKCLETAMRETRTMTILQDQNGVPAGSYVFHEYYCDDLSCDCRRVTIVVMRAEDERMTQPLATTTISYGWESPEFYRKWSRDDDPEYHRTLASATLAPLSSHSPVAEGLLDLLIGVLGHDKEFQRRFHKHYLEFRKAVRGSARRPGGDHRKKRR